MKNIGRFLIIVLCFSSCKSNKKPYTESEKAELLYACFQKYQDLLVLDIYSPPVASRMYVYPLLAANEAVNSSEGMLSKLKGFEKNILKPDNIEPSISMVVAFCKTGSKLIFSGEKLRKFQEELALDWEDRFDTKIIENSVAYGNKIAEVIIKRSQNDNYKITRGLDRFEVKTEPGLWVPTPPDYADATEPYWVNIKPLLLDSASQFAEPLTIKYSELPNSDFMKELMEVKAISSKLSEDDEQKIVFWDDNPFVSRQKGHLMFQDKKMTPGGHWLSICKTICQYKKANLNQIANAMAISAIATFEAFIASWQCKYATNRVRPETVINQKIDPNWHPYLVTPSFPAFTSGHSTVSSSAATVLTSIFGNFAYIDSTEKPYNLTVRNFKSFNQAAAEASVSRILAGIHYRSDCEKGANMGANVGNFVAKRLIIK